MHLGSDSAVRRRMRDTPVTYVIFDLLYLDGRSTLPLPYEDRRERARGARAGGPGLAHARLPPRRGQRAARRDQASSGSRGSSPSASTPSTSPAGAASGWIKVKNVDLQDVVIGGWTPGEGGRSAHLGALAVGVTEDGRLVYAGKVGTGFTESTLTMLRRELEPLRRADSPFEGRQPPKGTIFVEPRLVASVEFREWTRAERCARPRSRASGPTRTRKIASARKGSAGVRTGTFEGMPRAIWSGAISFGLVNIPVKLYSAVSQKTVRFHQLDAESGQRIRQQRVNPESGEEVPYEQIVKGYEIGPDRYVTITPEELDALEPQKTRTIDIEDFVDLDEIDPIFYDHPYYLAPDTGAGKAYRLLLDAMEDAGKVAIARVVIRSKENLVAIRPRDGVLTMETMLFADEVVPPDSLEELTPPTETKTSERELEMAKQLIDSLTSDFEPDKYRDEYRERVLEMIERKAQGRRPS